LRALKVEVNLVTCTCKRKLPARDYIQTTIAVEVRDRDVVKTQSVYLFHRPVVAATIPKPNEAVIHQANDVVAAVLIDIRDFETSTERAFGRNHVLSPARILVPDQPAAGVSAHDQVRPTVSINIANSLSPRGSRTALIHYYVVE
jgi:hypothetical protein